jgi:hypothetical protein
MKGIFIFIGKIALGIMIGIGIIYLQKIHGYEGYWSGYFCGAIVSAIAIGLAKS